MIRPRECLWLALLAWPVLATATVFSGEVQMADAQGIYTPPSMSSPVVLRYYVPDGAHVGKGDVLLRIDAGPAEAQLRKLKAQLVQTEAKNAKEIAELELKHSDAQLALADAQAERDTAALDAAVPRSLISALNYDRYQSEMERTGRALAVKREAARQAAEAVARRRRDSELELAKQRLSLGFYQDQVTQAEVRATRTGTVIHGFDNVFGNGGRFEEGSSSYPGNKVGEVVGKGDDYTVTAWVLEPDRDGLKVGQAVHLAIDALPGSRAAGHIKAIAGASIDRKEWGDGRYFEIAVALDKGPWLALRPGMSVRVDTEAEPAETAPVAPPDAPLAITGELFAQSSLAISPPAVDGLWQLTVTRMADDGAKVRKGEPLVVFDGSEVTKNLTAKRSELAEKQRRQEQLKLDLADRAREAELATAQARADAEKARRKASVPKDYVAGIEYRKLVVARARAEQKLRLTVERERIAKLARAAEQRLADAEVDQLSDEVAELNSSLGALTVKAPRDGILLHEAKWNGEKIDNGSQVWRGQSVGQMPDLSTLAVRAALPERELPRVRVGQGVQVRVAGGGRQRLDGTVTSIGNNVHSKSRVEAIPVVDVLIQLQGGQHAGLKPGQSVQVAIAPAGEGA
ncbi:HlyD family efflux transporter periplasmic adaptor subunit [Frateuria sp. MAH-13]|uniref:HlyD family efflux transporter periplasmic adaptor subunit n=1 Tax=Frateuria flava TaxID=2821489 RepID=A0ABS4DMS2_9GAMM|nr:HlyD family efflux transporter periplasmic adaptor subunit [Frateuria flava]MBP1474363.1 HlyD family efflux transporter periplasmic adaptor subunit [Frateuria flava]